MNESCLVSRLERFVDLTERERDFVAYMERDTRRVMRGDVIIEIGEDVEHLHVLKYGWAVVRSSESDGRRAILRIYLPGEVIGMAELGRREALHELRMQTDGAICPFPRSAIARMFDEVPRLAALLLAISSLDQMVLREEVRTLARLTAEERVTIFLVTLRDRLSVANRGMGNRLSMPLSQGEIGDAVGLTSVYVNKVLKRLREAGRIETGRDFIRLTEREAMEEAVGYRSILTRVDTSWFPAP